MNREHNEQHAQQVDAWIEQNITKLPAGEQLRLFEAAIEAIEKRILVTLSDITLDAVLDRALYQSQQEHPLLSKIQFDAGRLSYSELHNGISGAQGTELSEAFRYFLIEILAIVENLTAGIMIKPLYQELSRVSANSKSTKGGEDS